MRILCNIWILLIFALPVWGKSCTGSFVNPITDICWECMFPITIGSFEVIGSNKPDSPNPSSPACFCTKPLKVGIIGGFWDPSRLVDVSHEPYCFVNLGGMEIDMGITRGMGARSKASGGAKISSWYVHYYMYPILEILKLGLDGLCFEKNQLDIAYMTELDASVADDDLASILHPEVFLFNNIVSQAACSADCIKSSMGLPIDKLFWCAGCQGSMYPFSGNVSAHIGGVQASTLLAQKMVFKMYRLGLAKHTAADSMKEICNPKRSLVMKKSTHRYQMVNPNPDTCQQFGKTTTTFEANKEIPVVGEDFGYVIWKKRNCCIGFGL
ncbi:MAG: TraU family protein [Rickettsiales bacterium]|nr:TraU family protein [Rickettsiales bacterium]